MRETFASWTCYSFCTFFQVELCSQISFFLSVRFIVFGCLAAFLEGGVFPVYAIVLGEIVAIMNSGNDESEVNL